MNTRGLPPLFGAPWERQEEDVESPIPAGERVWSGARREVGEDRGEIIHVLTGLDQIRVAIGVTSRRISDVASRLSVTSSAKHTLADSRLALDEVDQKVREIEARINRIRM